MGVGAYEANDVEGVGRAGQGRTKSGMGSVEDGRSNEGGCIDTPKEQRLNTNRTLQGVVSQGRLALYIIHRNISTGSCTVGTTPKSTKKFFIQIASFEASQAVIYSDSACGVLPL
ncbi:hypothetical protein Tco_0706510 [Tanacetum coccineum]|uniref:Uncharacterized protein n=1 Tax=Tanacetum coccineum TaxID=301880 RepID=A0ABQ4Y7L1_9ASTR